MKEFFELLFKFNLKGIFVDKTENEFLRFFRYLFVGGASFITDYVILHIITEAGVYYLVSGVISFLAGLAVNYLLSKLLVWTEKQDMKKEIFVFTVVAVVGLGLTELLMWLFTEKLLWYYMLSKAVAAVLVLFWNYFMKKFLLYSKKK